MKPYEINAAKRTALGLTQKQLAEMCGISGATVSSYEAGGEVSYIVAKAIDRELKDRLKNLDFVEARKIGILTEAILLVKDKSKEGNLKEIAFMTKNIGYLMTDLVTEQ